MQEKSVAIDGPAGAGKSTLARALARELGYLYVDTGAIYRTVALRGLGRQGPIPSDPEQVAPLLEGLDLRMAYGADGVQRMYLSGRDVTEAIRVHQISGTGLPGGCPAPGAGLPAGLSAPSGHGARRGHGRPGHRDGGAPSRRGKGLPYRRSPEARARRRLLELKQRGQETELETVLRDIVQRDEQDRNRAVAPSPSGGGRCAVGYHGAGTGGAA